VVGTTVVLGVVDVVVGAVVDVVGSVVDVVGATVVDVVGSVVDVVPPSTVVVVSNDGDAPGGAPSLARATPPPSTIVPAVIHTATCLFTAFPFVSLTCAARCPSRRRETARVTVRRQKTLRERSGRILGLVSVAGTFHRWAVPF